MNQTEGSNNWAFKVKDESKYFNFNPRKLFLKKSSAKQLLFCFGQNLLSLICDWDVYVYMQEFYHMINNMEIYAVHSQLK